MNENAPSFTTFPALQGGAGVPTVEGTTLFAAGVAWLSIVGFPPVVDDKKPVTDQAAAPDQKQQHVDP